MSIVLFCDVSRCGYIFVYSTWSFLYFLEVYISIFHFGHHFFKYSSGSFSKFSPFLVFPLCIRCSVTQSCPTLCDSIDWSMPGFPVPHHPPEFAQTHVLWIGDFIQPSYPMLPFSSCPESFPASGSFLISHLFISGGPSIVASASASVLSLCICPTFLWDHFFRCFLTQYYRLSFLWFNGFSWLFHHLLYAFRTIYRDVKWCL